MLTGLAHFIALLMASISAVMNDEPSLICMVASMVATSWHCFRILSPLCLGFRFIAPFQRLDSHVPFVGVNVTFGLSSWERSSSSA